MTTYARVSSRHYLSSELLWTCMHNAERCRTRESELLGVRLTDVLHRSYAITSVLSAVSFLEALANETYGDAADTRHSSSRLGTLDNRARSLMGEFWRATQYGKRYVGVLDKFQLALLFAGVNQFDPGGNPHQDAALLVRLRNELVHFRTEWQSPDQPHKLEQQLGHRFAGSALSPGSHPWFPGAALGAGCADWAYATCKALADEWADRLGVVRTYEADLQVWAAAP